MRLFTSSEEEVSRVKFAGKKVSSTWSGHLGDERLTACCRAYWVAGDQEYLIDQPFAMCFDFSVLHAV
jgi:hypothetical protein